MTRILMIADTAPPLYGGAGTQAAALAGRLRAAGHDVELVARQKERVTVATEGTTFARPFIRNPSISSLTFCLSVTARVVLSRADIIHVHGGYAYAFVAVAAARLRRIPTIVKVTLLGSDDPATIGRRRLLGFPVGALLARVFGWADAVIALNEQVRDEILRAQPTARIRVISNGVDPLTVAKSVQTSPVVCYTGALSRRKGIDTLLAAWPHVRATLPEARLRLVGPVHPDLAGALEDTSVLEALGVSFEGLVPPAAARRAIAESSVFVLPSRHEGQPNALIEAMSAGLACCASDIPVNLETGADAIIAFTVGDPGRLAEAIATAWEQREELSRRARRRAADFDFARVTAQYSELYASLMAGER